MISTYPNIMAATVALRKSRLHQPLRRTDRLPPRASERLDENAAPDWPQILRRCLGGDRSAWAELVGLEYRQVYALCRRLSGSGEDAEDLTQEVFLKVYSKLGTFDPVRGNFRTWITTITRNQVVDHLRRTRNQRLTDSIDAAEEFDDGSNPEYSVRLCRALADGRPSAHEDAVRAELAESVERALRRLRPELREPVVLRDLEDLDYREIARVLSVPEGTVKSRISRGRAELARLLERNRKQVM